MIKPLQTIDRISLTLMVILGIVMGLLIWGGKACGTDCFLHTGPQVRNFSWQNQQIGAEDTAFILTFDRPMERASISENFSIAPPLPGKISWAGKRLAYTLETPAPYGEVYQVELQGARERFFGEEAGEVMQPFMGQFSTRDRAFAYIGNEGDEQGRLILYNLTRKRQTVLTPPDLVVIDFQFYPKGERILFSATQQSRDTLGSLNLYTVATGINGHTEAVKLILDSQNYQNSHFDLAKDGQTIVVGRVNRRNPTDFGLWVLKPGKKPQQLSTSGGEFLIAPDSQTLAIAQGEGIGLLSLKKGAKPLDFLPQFGRVLSFSSDGSAAAMVNFNQNNPELLYTRSLFYVNNQGVQKELANIQGSIIDCQFNPNATQLYCLLTERLEGTEYQEQPYLAQIDVETSAFMPLLKLPSDQDIHISIAPDGLGLLFDQVETANTDNPNDSLRTDSGEAIVGSRLWILILPSPLEDPSQPQLEPLPLLGIHPQWLP